MLLERLNWKPDIMQTETDIWWWYFHCCALCTFCPITHTVLTQQKLEWDRQAIYLWVWVWNWEGQSCFVIELLALEIWVLQQHWNIIVTFLLFSVNKNQYEWTFSLCQIIIESRALNFLHLSSAQTFNQITITTLTRAAAQKSVDNVVEFSACKIQRVKQRVSN